MGNVLVVDDKEMLRDSVGVTLQRAGHTVLAASGGEAALEAIARQRPDAVVTDLKMPGMTGLELLERVDLPPVTRYRLVGVGLANFIDSDDAAGQPGLFE